MTREVAEMSVIRKCRRCGSSEFGVKDCLPCSRARSAKRRAENPELLRQQLRESRLRTGRKNEAKYKSTAKPLTEAQRIARREATKRWCERNPEKNREMKAKTQAKVLSDPAKRMAHSVRVLIRKGLSAFGHRKQSRTQEILGCTFDEFKRHIERQFLPGMTWEKMGAQIHLDHIVPLSSAKNPEEVVRLSHFTNIRPMWASENVRKSNRVTHLI